MSGIAGVYRFDGGSVEADTVAAMTEAIDHRGPDGEWTWRDGPVGLGHQRFETTPEAEHAGSPPERGGRVLTFDGRIDNREELLSALDIDGPAGTVADADLVLAAYERWGEDCPERLIGAFAFAIFDPDAERLFLARDHAGLRLLYYYRGDEFLAFASEIKALWALEGVPREIDEIRLANWLAARIESDERTYYEDVRRLAPAHAMMIDSGGCETTEYWRLDPDREIRLDSEEAYAERFRELFDEAVRCRLRASGRVGATLSGGLDSSSIVTAAHEIGGDGDALELAHTYSAVFDAEETPKSDEREYIDAVLDSTGITPRFVPGNERNPLGNVRTMMWHVERPHIGTHHYIHQYIYRQAGEDDIEVLLDGLGGDTTVGHGVGYLPELFSNGRWIRYAREMSALNERFEDEFTARQLLVNMTLRPLLPAPVWRAYARLRNDEFRQIVNPVLDPEFVERTNLEERLMNSMATRPRTTRARHHSLILGNARVDSVEGLNKTGGAIPLEPRYPYLDRRLMEYCLALPPDQRLRNGWSRYVMREAMAGTLPESIRGRGDKGNLSPGYWSALETYAMDDIEKLLFADDPHIAEYVDVDRVRERYHEAASGDPPSFREFWYPTVLEIWLRLENGGQKVK